MHLASLDPRGEEYKKLWKLYFADEIVRFGKEVRLEVIEKPYRALFYFGFRKAYRYAMELEIRLSMRRSEIENKAQSGTLLESDLWDVHYSLDDFMKEYNSRGGLLPNKMEIGAMMQRFPDKEWY